MSQCALIYNKNNNNEKDVFECDYSQMDLRCFLFYNSTTKTLITGSYDNHYLFICQRILSTLYNVDDDDNNNGCKAL